MPAIVKPGVAGPEPANRFRVHALVQEPDARVHRRLAGPEHRVGRRRSRCRGKVVDGYEPGPRRNLEARRVRGGHGSLEVPCVDHPAAHGDVVDHARAQVSDLLAAGPSPQVLVAGEDPDLPYRREPPGDLGEVLADVLSRRPFVVPGVLPRLIDAVVAECQRVHAVVRRRGVQADEGIGVQPMPSRRYPPVDHHHLDVRLCRQRVGEGEPAGTGPYDQIIGFEEQEARSISPASRKRPRLGGYAARRISSQAMRASGVVGSKSAFVRASTSPRSAHSCSLEGRPQNQ